VSRYQKGKTNLDFTEARDGEWHWHQLGHMQVSTSLQTDTMPAPHHSVFLQAGCPSCRPTNSVKALKAERPRLVFYNVWLVIAEPEFSGGIKSTSSLSIVVLAVGIGLAAHQVCSL